MTEIKQNHYADLTDKELVKLTDFDYSSEPDKGVQICRAVSKELYSRKYFNLSGHADSSVTYWLGFRHGRNHAGN